MRTTHFKGIALFGAPGTGKSTLAQDLLPQLRGAKLVEAYAAVIQPSAAWRATGRAMPTGAAALARELAAFHGRKLLFAQSREEARATFEMLRRRYGQAFVARTLMQLHASRFAGKPVVFSGVRGLRNAKALKKAGYLVVYLEAPDAVKAARLSRRESFSKRDAETERQIEERMFSTNAISKVAHVVVHTGAESRERAAALVLAQFAPRECAKCLNSSVNPAVQIGPNGLCDVCESFRKYYRPAALAKELAFLKTLRGSGTGVNDAMVGISGGKDSTATLYEVLQLGFRPLAFSMDTGYYPKHIFPRAAAVAEQLGVPYAHIDARGFMRPADRECFKRSADLYDLPDSEETRQKFRQWYAEGRRHYSVKCAHAIPFVRTCQLCRRLIVRAYYAEAVKRGVRVIIIGINEWAGLSQDSSKRAVFSGIRKLQPSKKQPAVYVVHLPFILRRSIKDTEKVLRRLCWKVPRGERLIESNSNSCLFALAAESKARRMLGFHPDTSRLSREVTVGFITKAQARKALDKRHTSKQSVREVLKKSGVL